MIQHKKLSVLMATFNGEKFISEQIESLVNQTRLPDELIVTDDCSTDGTVQIIKNLSKTLPFPVKIHVNTLRQGWARNFMAGTELCSHELISFCDQDDIWYKDKISAVCAKFNQTDVLLVCHDADVVDDNLNHLRRLAMLPEETTFSPLQISPWINAYGFTQVFHRDLLNFNHLWPQSFDHDRLPNPMAHDQWFFFLASVLGKVIHIPQPLAAYRQHGGNAVGFETPGRSETLWRSIQGKNVTTSGRQEAATARRFIVNAMSWDNNISQNNILVARNKYARLTSDLQLRYAIYSSGMLKKLICFTKILVRRGYFDNSGWRFDIKSLIKDLFMIFYIKRN